jgi:P2 family phage contractile tail tube protein
MNLHLGGVGHRGIISEVTLPKLTQKVIDWRNGGMIAPLKSVVGLEALEVDFTNAGLVKTAIKDFGAAAYDGVIARFSGAYQEDGSGAVSTLVATCVGQYTEIDMGNAKVGDDTNHKAKLSLAYYQLDVDGVNWITIDIMNSIFLVFGVDRYAEIRAAVAD